MGAVVLSLVVPMYNVEPYIGKCINSCLHQNIPIDQYEIIIIDDGSTDNSSRIVKDVIRDEKNVRYIRQANAGLSAARNAGKAIAEGDYVWFIDSDDWIESNCLADIVKLLETSKPDILQLQYRYTYDGFPQYKVPEPCAVDKSQSGKDLIKAGVMLPIPAQFAIYRKDFLEEHSLSFYPGIYHEDLEFKPRTLYFAQSVISYNKIVYNYYQRSSGSITSKFKLKNGLDLIVVARNLYNFTIDEDLDIDSLLMFNRLISMSINNALNGSLSLEGKDRSVLLTELKKNKDLFHIYMQSKKLKDIIEGAIFTFNFKAGYIVYKLVKNIMRQ